MILVNDKQVEFTKFPDGTTSFRYNPFGSMTRIFNITWKYDGDEECILLWYLVNHIRDHDRDVRLRLLLPYIPNARMDRVKNDDEVFTLKYFCDFINWLGFSSVYVFDVVNIGRQVISNYFLQLRDEFTLAYEQKNKEEVMRKGLEMLELLSDLDMLLSCHSTFSFGRW